MRKDLALSNNGNHRWRLNMNQEVKAQWVQALRSSEYEQGKGALHIISGDGKHRYCCLGVLCELAVKAGVAEVISNQPQNYKFTDSVFPGDSLVRYGSRVDIEKSSNWSQVAILPESVMRWAGLGDKHGWTRPNGDSLAGLNDAGVGFDVIADLIKVNL
jgi:hypothetical protein